MTVSISFPSHVPPPSHLNIFSGSQVVTRSFISRFWLTWRQQQLRFFFSYYNWIYNLTSLFYSHWQNVWLTGPDNVCSFPSCKREKREKREKTEKTNFHFSNEKQNRPAAGRLSGLWKNNRLMSVIHISRVVHLDSSDWPMAVAASQPSSREAARITLLCATPVSRPA